MTQLIYCHAVALIVVEKSAARQLSTTIYSLRTCVENMVSQNFEKAEKRSISRMQHGPNSGSPNSESGMADGRWRVPHDDWPVRGERWVAAMKVKAATVLAHHLGPLT